MNEPDYKELYHLMVNAAEDAIRAIEQTNYGIALEKLISAQQKAEQHYIEAE